MKKETFTLEVIEEDIDNGLEAIANGGMSIYSCAISQAARRCEMPDFGYTMHNGNICTGEEGKLTWVGGNKSKEFAEQFDMFRAKINGEPMFSKVSKPEPTTLVFTKVG